MPVPTETFWNTRKVSVMFAASSVALLASVLWMVKVDYARPWRGIQDRYTDLQASLAYFDLLGTQTHEAQKELADVRGDVERLQKELDDQQERIDGWIGALERDELDAGILEGLWKELSGEGRTAYVERARQRDEHLADTMADVLESGDLARFSGLIEDDASFRQGIVSVLQWSSTDWLEGRGNDIGGDYARADLKQKNLKSELGVAVTAYEYAKSEHGENDPHTQQAKQERTAIEERYTEALRQFEQLADERQAIEDRLKALRSDVSDAERALARIEKVHADAQKAYADYSSTIKRGIYNLPLADFAAPKGTPGRNEIKQAVLPDVKVELHFVQNYQTDRCMTCHVAIDNREYTKENLARRLEKAVFSINEKLARDGKTPFLEAPAVAEREDLEPGHVAAGWRTLTHEQQDRFFDRLVHEVNRFQNAEGGETLAFGQPLLAHPDLDLYVAPDSPHPMSQMGCTVCHDGNGEETDFVLAAHTPKSHEERKAWEEKYYVNTAWMLPEQDFETAEHHWERPMLVPRYAEAGCTKCHPKVADIATHDGEPAAGTINEGRFLFTSLGCINCHLVNELEGTRKVGPDLKHVGGKITKGFAHNWIWFPKDYRPSTNMPHYFEQENNDAGSETAGGDGDPVLRAQTEVIAMTEYLFAVSDKYAREPLPEDLWASLKEEESEATTAAAERGRRLFGEVGCLACHATLAYKPTTEEGEPGESIGATWIAADLEWDLEGLAIEVQRAKAKKLKKGLESAEVSLTEVEAIAERLAVAVEENDKQGIPLAGIIEVFDASFEGEASAGRGAGRYNADRAKKAALRKLLKVSAEDLAGVELTEDEGRLLEISDEALDKLWDHAYERYEAMAYVDRVEYAMRNFKDAKDTIFQPDTVTGPVFSRFAPELSSIRTKFEGYEQSVAWLYDWLKNPRHYSSYTKMPSLRLKRGPVLDPVTGVAADEAAEADEALDIAVYLSTLAENEAFPTEPFDADAEKASAYAAKRDELIKLLLGGLNSAARSEAILHDESGELTERLVARLADSMGGKGEARALIESMDLDERQWLFLGDKMIGHYGCFACHDIRGFESAARPGTEMTGWGEKLRSQLDFGFFEHDLLEPRQHGEYGELFDNLYPPDREKLSRWAGTNPHVEVEHTLASFAWHKLRNPRIWDRKKVKSPYEKLKMPNFFVTDAEADALVTFLLSRRPARLDESIQVDYARTPAGKVADGRNLVRELNCIACHKIDGNGAVVHQYITKVEGGEKMVDELNAPPWLRGQGAKVQAAWFYKFLNDVEMLRPWLKVRMPSFRLTNEQTTTLVEYFVGLSQEEAQWLAAHLSPVEKYISEKQSAATGSAVAQADFRPPDGPGGGDVSSDEAETDAASAAGADWYRQDSLANQAELLRKYGVRNGLVAHASIDPTVAEPAEIESAFEKIVGDAQFLRDLYDVTYPFTEALPSDIPADMIADGESIFFEVGCLACHVFGDPKVPGANAFPTAPNLQLTHRRLRAEWVRKWLEGPGRIQPGTKMPDVFGSLRESAFKAYPEEDRERVAKLLRQEGLIDDGPAQIEAVTAFLYDAGARQLNKIPPEGAETPEAPTEGDAGESTDAATSSDATPEQKSDASDTEEGGERSPETEAAAETETAPEAAEENETKP